MARQYYQGIFTPKHPDKYIGDVNNIIFRSSYEKKFMLFCDANENVIHWNSEGLSIPYFNKLDNKTHKYYPDFLISVTQADGIIKKILIEIKPEKQTIPPTGKKMTKRLTEDIITYNKNIQKWSAARAWCDEHQIEFKILTEKSLGIA
jgi:hypothetical protein